MMSAAPLSSFELYRDVVLASDEARWSDREAREIAHVDAAVARARSRAWDFRSYVAFLTVGLLDEIPLNPARSGSTMPSPRRPQ